MKNVKNILLDSINDPKGQDWCNDVTTGDDDCKRLSICMAIELRKPGNEVVLKNHIDIIFQSCDYDRSFFLTDSSYPRKWFSKRIDSIRHHLKDPNGCIIPNTEVTLARSSDNIYVTFLSFYRLKTYYLDRLGLKFSIDSNNEKEVNDFLIMYPNVLDEINFFGNSNYPVWVTTKEEVERIKNDNPSYNKATNIMNLLGLQPDTRGMSLFPSTGDMFFQIEYPKYFDITTYQPTSLNKYWVDAKNDLFLSYIKKNCFGQTYATDACCKSAGEQIHEPFECLNKNLMIFYIGKHMSLSVDKKEIINEGLKRIDL